MMDKHLKFSSKAEAESVLFDEVDDALIPKFNFSIDNIGVIYKETGTLIDSEYGPIPETTPISGWHVNVRGVGPDDFAEYEVTVATPVRNWA
jgi:hypothetical protein